MRVELARVHRGGRMIPAALATCQGCGAQTVIYAYAGEIPAAIRPAANVLVDKFQAFEAPGAYICPSCEAKS